MRLPGGTLSTSYDQELAVVRTRLQWILLVGSLLLMIVLPLFSSSYLLRIVANICITVVAVLGLNILTGYCGQISLGHAAFVAVGAYTSAILTSKLGISFWIALPCAGVVAALMGIIFGLPALKIKGLYLALTTLAAHYIIMYVISWPAAGLTGGTAGIRAPSPTFLGISLEPLNHYYYVILTIALIMTFFSRNLLRTKIGRAFVAIRDNDKAAEIMGINLAGYKLLAFALGCFYAGVAGCLWAHYAGIIDTDHFLLWNAIWYVGMLIVGGMGSNAGVFFGVIFLSLIQVVATEVGPLLARIPVFDVGIAASFAQILFGLIIILFLVYEPRGLAHRWEVFKASYRIWPFPY